MVEPKYKLIIEVDNLKIEEIIHEVHDWGKRQTYFPTQIKFIIQSMMNQVKS